jgi:hypothetical protein
VRERALEAWDGIVRDPAARWSALGAAPILWLSLAWRDPRLLLTLAILALGPVLARRVRGEDGAPGEPL